MAMVTAPAVSEYVGVGLYALGDAAKLLQAPPRNIRRWLGGYVYRDTSGEVHRMPPLWDTDLPKADDHIELSFRDLIELRFVKAFVEAGIGLKAIRYCLDYARSCVDSDRPFSTGQFRTDGKTIFLESLERAGEPKLLDLRRKQYVFKQVVGRSFKDLDLEDDAVAQWRPFHGKASIVVDPKRAFGQPIAANYGVPTVVLAEAVKAEGSEARVARLFEVSPSVVRDAVRFEGELLAA